MDKTSSQKREFLHYRLEADMLCLGERERAGSFRPCLDVFTYTALVGALKARFPHPDRRIHAVGRFLGDPNDPTVNARDILIFAPRDRGREVSSIPLQIEYLANVRAEVFVFKNDFTVKWPDQFTIHLGALRSKGFGHCRLTRIGDIACGDPQEGLLAARLPDPEIDTALPDVFSIRKVLSPIYGYVFQPDRGGTGHYVRALFEGTRLVADPVVLQPEPKQETDQ